MWILLIGLAILTVKILNRAIDAWVLDSYLHFYFRYAVGNGAFAWGAVVVVFGIATTANGTALNYNSMLWAASIIGGIVGGYFVLLGLINLDEREAAAREHIDLRPHSRDHLDKK